MFLGYICSMSVLKKIFNFYINSSIHVGIEVSCFVLVTCLQFDIAFDLGFLLFVFFGTITGYNFIKYAGTAKLHHKSLEENLKIIQVFSFFCFLALIYFAFSLSLETLLWIAFFGVFTVFYAVPVFPNKKNLRSFKGIKIFVIAFVVAGLTVIVPLVHHHYQGLVSENVWWVMLQRIAFIIAVVIPFEIRDLNFDNAELGTIPQEIGARNAKLLGLFLLLLFLGIEFVKRGTSVAELISAVIISLASAGFIVFSTSSQTKYYASFWVEGIPIGWFIIFWSLTGFFF